MADQDPIDPELASDELSQGELDDVAGGFPKSDTRVTGSGA
ncbi:MAG: hypothetical protein WCP26_08375 [Actinomycetes bacterium]